MGVTKYPGATNRQQDFTSSGTWTCPSGVYSAEFLVVGAGGGGGGTSVSSATFYAAGGGGGGGAVKKVNLTTTPGSTYTITIGAKGTGSSAALGGNGGYTEILLSGTTLIRSFGGQGGGACIADVQVTPTGIRTLAGGGGEASTGSTGGTQLAGGGGGAANGSTAATASAASVTNQIWGAEGTKGNTNATAASSQYTSFGAIGIEGYGAGGSGGSAISVATTRNLSGNSYFAGAGALVIASGQASGGNAVANTGCGGGGGACYTSNTSTSGGNGADGLVRVVYFA